MPAVAPREIVSAIVNAFEESGCTATLTSPLQKQPRHFVVVGQNTPTSFTVYAWSLTPGGRPSLPNEYRIQMTSVKSPLSISPTGPTILVGFDAARNLFGGFDLARHQRFTTGSPSIQIGIAELREAEKNGLSFYRKSNEEIAIGIRPDMFVAYAMNAALLHRYGRDANIRKLLDQAVIERPIPQRDVEDLPAERQRVVAEVSRLSRDARFKQRVLFAYGNRCAVTRVQLRLVDAAHILPVGAPGSSDAVTNGLSLSPTYHRAYDAGLIYLDANYKMQLNEARLQVLQALNLALGIESFRQPLGEAIFLPPDPKQRPSIEIIRKANEFRQIAA
ncbi:MAG: HNH endonuclease signature motif containing protein [Terriglobales bacterium]